LGQGALVEAAGVVGVYKMMTKLVDATGKQLPRLMFWLGQVLVAAIEWIFAYFNGLEEEKDGDEDSFGGGPNQPTRTVLFIIK
jgi:hypothetical protein